MAESESAKPDKYEAQLKQAIDDLRGNAKWALLAFGAIGTTLLAGSQLSNLGRFQIDDHRLWAALFFAVLALGAATYAVRAAMAVASTGAVELYNLEDADIEYLERNPAILEGFGSVSALKKQYQDAIAGRYASLTQGNSSRELLERYENWYHYIDSVVDKVLAYIRYNRVRTQADRARRELSVASVCAAVGLVGFAWAANPASEQAAIVLQAPASPAKLALTDAGATALAPLVGAQCATREPIDVIVLSLTTAGSEVVSLKSEKCAVARFTLTPALGKLTPVPR